LICSRIGRSPCPSGLQPRAEREHLRIGSGFIMRFRRLPEFTFSFAGVGVRNCRAASGMSGDRQNDTDPGTGTLLFHARAPPADRLRHCSAPARSTCRAGGSACRSRHASGPRRSTAAFFQPTTNRLSGTPKMTAQDMTVQVIDSDDLLTDAGVAEMCRVSIRTIQRLVAAGDFSRPVYIGRCRRWRRSAVLEHLADRGR
jgi:predicted DNA-binding transcriptional regulator AlpA